MFAVARRRRTTPAICLLYAIAIVCAYCRKLAFWREQGSMCFTMNLSYEPRRGGPPREGFNRDGFARLEQRQRGQNQHSRACDEGHPRVEIPPQSPCPQPRGR